MKALISVYDKTGVIDEMYNKLSFIDPLDEQMNRLYKNLDQRGLFQVFKDNQSTINSLVPEMINPERSVNNITDASYEDIQSILDQFFLRTED